MQDRHSLLDTVTTTIAPPHRDGYKFVVPAALAAIVLVWLLPAIGWPLAVLAGWIAYFFRDPKRVTPLREGLIIAPADGRISAIDRVRPPAEMGLGETERVRISVFLNIFDVHINRSPIAGRITRSIYVPGSFLNAAVDKASEENERRALVITTPAGVEVGVVQIAGLIARRIVTWRGEGETIGVGERFGLIRFGSRTDVYLPPGHGALVAVGQRAVGGETVFADLRSEEPEREARSS